MNSKRKGHCARYQTYIKHAFAVCETISFSVISFYANNINSLYCIKGRQSSKFKCTYNLAPLDSLSTLTKLNLLASLLLEVSITKSVTSIISSGLMKAHLILWTKLGVLSCM